MEQESKGHANRWRALIFIGVSLLVISLDNTVLNVALPEISRELGASAADLQWIIDAYILVFAALLLTIGSISDRIGRKRALQAGLVLFGIGSLAAALSTTTTALIASRAFLGIGGATIMPATLSIITATFRDAKERSQAIAIWAAVFGLGVGIGPVVGGWLLERFDWNSVFFVNLPVIAVALVGGYLFISESKDENAPRPDFPGVILSIIGLFALVYGIIEAGFHGWDASNVLAAFGVATIFLIAFAWWENRTDHPMLSLDFFKNMSFTGANTALALVTFSLFGTIFFISQYFQSVQGYTPLETGLRVLPMALILMVSAGMSARVTRRLGIKLTVGIGILFAALGLFILSQVSGVDTEYGIILIGLGVLAVGMGTAMSPATDSIMGAIPLEKAGIGSAMNDTTRQLGGALGVAVLGTIMNNTYLSQISALNKNEILLALPEEVLGAINSSIQGAHIIADNLPLPLIGDTIKDTANLAFVNGMTDAMLIGAIVMVAAAAFTFAVLPAEIRRPDSLEASEAVEGTVTIVPAMGD